MAEYPNVPFTSGDDWTPDLAYKAFYSPIFDGQTNLLGHRNPIQDAELDPTGIRASVNLLQNGLKCSVVSGLTVAYTTGQALNPTGNIVTIPAGQVVVPDRSE